MACRHASPLRLIIFAQSGLRLNEDERYWFTNCEVLGLGVTTPHRYALLVSFEQKKQLSSAPVSFRLSNSLVSNKFLIEKSNKCLATCKRIKGIKTF